MRRTLLAVALAASLAPTSSPGFFHPLWSLLSALWTAPASQDAGCGADPSGRCAPNLQTDEGPGWDPDGRSASALQTDAGCGADPDGRCNPGS